MLMVMMLRLRIGLPRLGKGEVRRGERVRRARRRLRTREVRGLCVVREERRARVSGEWSVK